MSIPLPLSPVSLFFFWLSILREHQQLGNWAIWPTPHGGDVTCRVNRSIRQQNATSRPLGRVYTGSANSNREIANGTEIHYPPNCFWISMSNFECQTVMPYRASQQTGIWILADARNYGIISTHEQNPEVYVVKTHLPFEIPPRYVLKSITHSVCGQYFKYSNRLGCIEMPDTRLSPCHNEFQSE